MSTEEDTSYSVQVENGESTSLFIDWDRLNTQHNHNPAQVTMAEFAAYFQGLVNKFFIPPTNNQLLDRKNSQVSE